MRTVIVLLSGMLLAGCTDADWSQTMTRLGVAGEPSNAAPSSWLGSQEAKAPSRPGRTTPVAQISHATASDAHSLGPQPGADDFCTTSARQDADRGSFDNETRDRVYRARLAQCQALVSR
jgi:hypothetical protein